MSPEETRKRITGLARRAQEGDLPVVVDASLEDRYGEYLASARLHAHRHPGKAYETLSVQCGR